MESKQRKVWLYALLMLFLEGAAPLALSDPLSPIDYTIECGTCADPENRPMAFVREALDHFNEHHPGATLIHGVIPGWVNYQVLGSSGGENDWVLAAFSREPDLGNALGLDGDVEYEAITAWGSERSGTFQAGVHFTRPGADDPGDDDPGNGASGGSGDDCGETPVIIP